MGLNMTACKNAELCGYVMHRSHLVVEVNAPDDSIDAGISKQERRSHFPGDFKNNQQKTVQHNEGKRYRPNRPPPTLMPSPLRCRGGLAPGGPEGMAGEPDVMPQRCVGGSCRWGSECCAAGLDSIPYVSLPKIPILRGCEPGVSLYDTYSVGGLFMCMTGDSDPSMRPS